MTAKDFAIRMAETYPNPDAPIAGMSAEDAYAAGYTDRKAGNRRRATAYNAGIAGVDYDLGWRDAAPGGNGWRD